MPASTAAAVAPWSSSATAIVAAAASDEDGGVVVEPEEYHIGSTLALNERSNNNKTYQVSLPGFFVSNFLRFCLHHNVAVTVAAAKIEWRGGTKGRALSRCALNNLLHF